MVAYNSSGLISIYPKRRKWEVHWRIMALATSKYFTILVPFRGREELALVASKYFTVLQPRVGTVGRDLFLGGLAHGALTSGY
jgi:hypothetical protein